jgi:hypothetical protein
MVFLVSISLNLALIFLKKYLFIYSHVHTFLGPFLPLAPHPLSLFLIPLASRQKLFCPVLQFVEEKT